MAVPKRKQSRSNTRTRRSTWKTSAIATVTCPNCKAPTRPHVACPACGMYRGRMYVEALQTAHAN